MKNGCVQPIKYCTWVKSRKSVMLANNPNPNGLYILKSPVNFFLVKVAQNSRADGTSVKVVPATFNTQDNFNALVDGSVASLPFGNTCLIIASSDSRSLISELEYFKNCSLGDTMERKSGTRHMVSATISFCADLLGDNFKKFGVQDATYFWCGHRQVNMWLHNLLVYGETYYERKFGATPDPEHCDIDLWESTKTKLDSENVTRDLVTMLSRETQELKPPLGLALYRIMDECVGSCTWKDMFNQLHYADGGNGCIFFSIHNLRTIQRFFNIKRVDKFQIEVTPKHRESLVAHEKILDGEESSLVSLDEIRKHSENKNV